MAKTKDKELRLIPAGEKMCIWMEAGVVSYKVCTNNCNCNNCQFHHAMSEVVKKEEKVFRVMKLKKERRKKERRKKESTTWVEEFTKSPAC